MVDQQLHFASIESVSRALATGELSAVELTESMLDRIAEVIRSSAHTPTSTPTAHERRPRDSTVNAPMESGAGRCTAYHSR